MIAMARVRAFGAAAKRADEAARVALEKYPGLCARRRSM